MNINIKGTAWTISKNMWKISYIKGKSMTHTGSDVNILIYSQSSSHAIYVNFVKIVKQMPYTTNITPSKTLEKVGRNRTTMCGGLMWNTRLEKTLHMIKSWTHRSYSYLHKIFTHGAIHPKEGGRLGRKESVASRW